MNIFDLSWCKLYLYDDRHDIGFPLVGASISMTVFVGVFIVGLIILPSTIGLYRLPNLPFLPFGIGLGLILSFFIFRHVNKKVRQRRLSECMKYEKNHPEKSKLRFLLFIIIPFLLLIADFIIANVRYSMLHGM